MKSLPRYVQFLLTMSSKVGFVELFNPGQRTDEFVEAPLKRCFFLGFMSASATTLSITLLWVFGGRASSGRYTQSFEAVVSRLDQTLVFSAEGVIILFACSVVAQVSALLMVASRIKSKPLIRLLPLFWVLPLSAIMLFVGYLNMADWSLYKLFYGATGIGGAMGLFVIASWVEVLKPKD